MVSEPYIALQNRLIDLQQEDSTDYVLAAESILASIERLEANYIKMVLPKLTNVEKRNFIREAYWYFSLPEDWYSVQFSLLGMENQLGSKVLLRKCAAEGCMSSLMVEHHSREEIHQPQFCAFCSHALGKTISKCSGKQAEVI